MKKKFILILLFFSILVLFLFYGTNGTLSSEECVPLSKSNYALETYNINKNNKWATFKDEDNGIFFIHPGNKNASIGVFTFKKDANFILTFSIRSGSKYGNIKYTIKKNDREIDNFIITTNKTNQIPLSINKEDTLSVSADKHGDTGYDWGNLQIQVQNDQTQFTLDQYKHTIYMFTYKYFNILLFILILITLVKFRDYYLTYLLSKIKNKSNIILNNLLLLYAFFIPLSLDMIRILAPLIIILWFIEGGVKSKIALIKKEPFFLSIGILLLVLLISLLWTDIDNIKFGIKYITRYWYILPMFAIYTSIEKKFIPMTLSAFLSGMFISELISYSIFFEFIHIEGVSHKDPSPFMHHTLYSIFLVFTVGILLNRMITSESIKHKVIYGMFFTTITANLFVNSGRTGQFLFLFVLASVLIGYYKITVRSLLITLSLLLIIPYLAFTFSPNFKTRMLQTYNNVNTISYSTPIGSRIGLNIVAKDIFFENPIIGVGVGDYLSKKDEMIQQRYPDRKYVKILVHYHNQYAEFAVIAGIFGLFSYIFIFISLIKTKITDRRMNTIKYILVSTIAIASLSDAMFHLNRPLSLFALFAGLILAHYRYEKSEIKDTSNVKNHISHK